MKAAGGGLGVMADDFELRCFGHYRACTPCHDCDHRHRCQPITEQIEWGVWQKKLRDERNKEREGDA